MNHELGEEERPASDPYARFVQAAIAVLDNPPPPPAMWVLTEVLLTTAEMMRWTASLQEQEETT